MGAQCSSRECPDGSTLPNCYYGAGSLNVGLGAYVFTHFVDTNYFCIPCCTLISNNPKMPGQ